MNIFSAGQEVKGGSVHVSVQGTGKLSFLNLEKDYDLCSVIPTRCPIKKGPASISITRQLPNIPIVSTL